MNFGMGHNIMQTIMSIITPYTEVINYVTNRASASPLGGQTVR